MTLKHEDFNSLELNEVIPKVLRYCREATESKSVHWISVTGLRRVLECTDEDWRWTFASADMMDQHVWNVPVADVESVFRIWQQVAKILPQPWEGRMASHVLSDPSRFVYPLCTGGGLVGVLVFDQPIETNPISFIARFKPGLDVATRYMRFAYQYLEARNLSYQDELTGLYNQRYLPLALDHEIQRCRRDKGEFTLLFLDIDYFKMVNDGRGHWVGSRLLVELGKVLKTQVRASDYCFRYGGDEFIVLLTNADLEGSKAAAERIRKAVETSSFEVEGHNLNLTVSIGLASYPTHAQSAVDLIQLADQAMYYGKRKSRNIVFVAS